MVQLRHWTCLLFIICAGACIAQNDKDIGVRAGVNYSNYIGEDAEESDFRLGAALGGYLELPISGRLSFQPELLISLKGQKIKWNNNYEFRSDIFYIEMPLYAVLQLEPLNLYAGPYIGVFLAGHYRHISRWGKNSHTDSDRLEGDSDIAVFDSGLSCGAEYIYSSWRLGGRYSMGFISVDPDGYYKAANSVFQLNIGYSLNNLF